MPEQFFSGQTSLQLWQVLRDNTGDSCWFNERGRIFKAEKGKTDKTQRIRRNREEKKKKRGLWPGLSMLHLFAFLLSPSLSLTDGRCGEWGEKRKKEREREGERERVRGMGLPGLSHRRENTSQRPPTPENNYRLLIATSLSLSLRPHTHRQERSTELTRNWALNACTHSYELTTPSRIHTNPKKHAYINPTARTADLLKPSPVHTNTYTHTHTHTQPITVPAQMYTLSAVLS